MKKSEQNTENKEFKSANLEHFLSRKLPAESKIHKVFLNLKGFFIYKS